MVQISFYDNDTGEFIKQWPNWTGVVPAVCDVVILHFGDNNEEKCPYNVLRRRIDGTRPDVIKLYLKQINKSV